MLAGAQRVANALDLGQLLDGRATAYVCIGTTCEAPITDPGALRERLARPRAAG